MRKLLWLLGLSALAVPIVLSGCARGGAVTGAPTAVLDVAATFNGTINDAEYYYFAFASNPGIGGPGPVPIANGPYRGNGWGTGPISIFVQYHQGAYTVYRANVGATLATGGTSGITGVSGSPTSSDSGEHTITVVSIARPASTVTGVGMIQAVADTGTGQNAGTIALQTDGAGSVVAGSVVFAPATDGGRAANAAEQTQLNALNAGGALTASSLSAFGITLTLLAPVAGTQTIQMLPATATVSDVFFNALTQATSPAVTTTLFANSSTPTGNPPIPGVAITAGDLVVGGVSRVELVAAGNLTALGVPLDKNLPTGTNQMRFTLDMAIFGGATTLAMNVITTDTINLNSASPEHSYDGLGTLGNNRVIFSTNDYRPFSNQDLFQTFDAEATGDATLQPTLDISLRNAIDIAAWSLTLRRL